MGNGRGRKMSISDLAQMTAIEAAFLVAALFAVGWLAGLVGMGDLINIAVDVSSIIATFITLWAALIVKYFLRQFIPVKDKLV